jgi:hypothetical protein
MKKLLIMAAIAATIMPGHAGAESTAKTIARLRAACAAQWPADYDMQVYCINKYANGARDASRVYKTGSRKQQDILTRCAMQWHIGATDLPDFDMAMYCYKKQWNAYQALQ